MSKDDLAAKLALAAGDIERLRGFIAVKDAEIASLQEELNEFEDTANGMMSQLRKRCTKLRIERDAARAALAPQAPIERVEDETEGG